MPKPKKRTRRPKHTIEYIRAELKKFGYKLLSKSYVGTKQPLKVECKNGHKTVICWNNFSRGYRCKQCFIDKQTTGSKALKKIILRDKYYCISEAARVLGVRGDDLRRHIDLGLLPGPNRSFGTAKKYYKLEDIKKLEKMIE